MSEPRVQLVVEYADHQTRYYPANRGWRIDSAHRCIVIGSGLPRTYVPLDQVVAFYIERVGGTAQTGESQASEPAAPRAARPVPDGSDRVTAGSEWGTTDQTTHAQAWSPPDDLYRIVAAGQAARWGYVRTLDPDALAQFIHDRAEHTNLRADVDVVWLHAWQRIDQAERTSRQLAETVARLDEHIDRRAAEIAAPKIAEVERAAAQELTETRDLHARNRQRWIDLEAEFRRQLDVQWRMNDRLRAKLAEAKADLARAEAAR